MRRNVVYLILLGFLSGFLLAPAARAASPTQGLTINPALKNIVLQPDQATADYTVTVENDTDQTLTIAPRATDFSATSINGSIDFKPAPDEQHGLAAYISFSQPQVTLEPKKSTTVRITINDAKKLGPGGHFTAVRYQAVPSKSSDEQVGLRSELVSFLFVSSAGQSTYNLKARWSMPHIIWGSIPRESAILFTNTGNTQSAPHGTITITGPPAGRRIAQGIINTNSSLVLPGATRLLQTGLAPQHMAFWPGRYTADLYYRADNGDYTHTRQSFIFVGWLCILTACLLLAVCIGIVYWFGKRRLKRKPDMPEGNSATGVEATLPKTDTKIKKSHRIPVKQL